MPSARRAVSVLCAALMCATLGAPAASWADPSTTTTTTTIGVTSTSGSATTTTTVASGSTSSSTSSTVATPPGTGVPKVPVGGPPTTTTTVPAGAPAPPPPNPEPVLVEVQTDLAQIQAIDDYQPALAEVNADQAVVARVDRVLSSAERTEAVARYIEAVTDARMQDAAAKLRGLAVEAYIGVGFASPDAGPQGGPGQALGTVKTPEGLTGIAAVDANEMLIVVSQDARRDVATSIKALNAASKYAQVAHAAALVADRRAQAAEEVLRSGQAALKIVTDAAVSPGAAANIVLPHFAAPAAPAGPTTTSVPTPFATTPVTTVAALTAKDSATTTTTVAGAATTSSPTILGTPVLDGSALAAWFESTGRKANTTVPIAELAQDYDYWGHQFGVRDDLAFAQSIIETGFFSFPAGGQLTGKDNNFAGIGACDSCTTGWSFPDAKTGVGAQIELLHAYATNVLVPNEPNFIGDGGVGGCCQTWMALAGKWASSLVYGISIMTIYNQMLTWYIPQRLAQLGLAAAAPSGSANTSPGQSPGTGQSSTTAAPS